LTAKTWAPVAVALVVRLAAILASDRVVADVLRYRRVAAHVLDVSWNPYLAPRLYPYPPVWIWIEAASEWLARHAGLSFAIVVKLPVLAAEIAIVALLVHRARKDDTARLAPWLYALHPIAILVSAFHGQFESLALLMVLLAIGAADKNRHDAAALALAAGIALKSFPVLLVPVFALRLTQTAARARFLALALLPVAALLVPYVLHDRGAVTRELFGYGGVADFGWIGAWRGVRYLIDGKLARGEASHWGDLIPVSKILFLAAYAAILARRPRDLTTAVLAVFVAFEAAYGALSAQYLLWVVPSAVLRNDRWHAAYTAAATTALVGFYLFLAPGVLTPAESRIDGAGVAWVIGTVSSLLVCVAWALRNASQLRHGIDATPRLSTTV
jgi:uncharacterized membrane protein